MDFKAKSDENKLIQNTLNWTAINAYTTRWKKDTWFDISITRKTSKKSHPMRRYYFAVVIREYANHLGYDADEIELLHRQLKIVYFQCKPDEKGVYRNVPHVFADDSKLDVSQKKSFCDWVVRSAARDGCYVPDPGE